MSSIEGYYQQWCRNGHVTNKDTGYHQDHAPGVCPICGEEIVLRNFVDDFEYAPQGLIDLKQLEITPEVETKEFRCIEGKWEHITKVIFGTYRIPTEEEKESLRQHFDVPSSFGTYIED
jgi:hypothetical protein